MPVKPLPKKLVQRLQRAAGVLDRYLGSMKPADWRHKLLMGRGHSPKNTRVWGGRVRKLAVSGNFPSTRVVLKRIHLVPALSEGRAEWLRRRNDKVPNLRKALRARMAYGLIKFVRGEVHRHNNRYPDERSYRLLPPIGYAVGKELIAMARTNAVTVAAFLYHFDKIAPKYFSKQKLEAAADLMCERTNFSKSNVLILSFTGGKFVFMPLIDLY